MIGAWYAILTFMLVMFLVLEGFDIGAGMLQYVVGRTDAERRLVIAAIGPLWSWHEVWLVGFGGTLLVAFPSFLAVSFAGFYLAFMLVLWCLILRGISIEVSGHIADSMWRTMWHRCFVSSNVLLAILIGAALGNVVRGVPLGVEGNFALAFFTNFQPTGNVGILDWYTISVAVFIFSTFALHGAIGLARRTDGVVHDRSMYAAAVLWKIVLLLLVVVTLETTWVRPGLFTEMTHDPAGWIGWLFVAVGAIAMISGVRGWRESRGLFGSSLFIAGLMISGAAGVFPNVLRSTVDPKFTLTAYQLAAAGHGLAVAMIWWPAALVLAVIYFLFIFRYYSGKVELAQDTQRPY